MGSPSLFRVAEKLKEQHAEQGEGIEAEAALLRRLIAQEVEEKPGGVSGQVRNGKGPGSERA